MERFWKHVEKDAPKVAHMKTNCWIWTGGSNPTNGVYGNFKISEGKTESAHRFSYIQEYGEPPADKNDISHLCDVTLCVRPEHLVALSHADNMRMAWERNRMGKILTEVKETIMEIKENLLAVKEDLDTSKDLIGKIQDEVQKVHVEQEHSGILLEDLFSWVEPYRQQTHDNARFKRYQEDYNTNKQLLDETQARQAQLAAEEKRLKAAIKGGDTSEETFKHFYETMRDQHVLLGRETALLGRLGASATVFWDIIKKVFGVKNPNVKH